MLAAAASDLAELARLLRSEAAGPRSVAMTQRLLFDEGSALYGYDVSLLRQELKRISFCTVSLGEESPLDDARRGPD